MMAAWREFWFGPQDAFNIALFRFLISGILLVMYSLRFLEMDLFFFEQGLMTAEEARAFFPVFYEPMLWWYPPTDLWVVIYQVLLLLALLAMTLGLGGRVVVWFALFLHLAFLQRNPTVIYGADTYTCFWLFYLAFTQSHHHFNLFRWWRSGWAKTPLVGQKLNDPWTTMGFRLVQVQLCISYAYTGLEKVRGETWWEGSALWAVFGNSQVSTLDFSFMYHFPMVVAAMTYLTLIFEVYFPIAIWVRSLRSTWLLLGLGLHGGVALMMGLPFFSLLMLSAYVLFLKPEFLRKFFRILQEFVVNQLPKKSAPQS